MVAQDDRTSPISWAVYSNLSHQRDGDSKQAYHSAKVVCSASEDAEKYGCFVGTQRRVLHPNCPGREDLEYFGYFILRVGLLCCTIRATCILSLSSIHLSRTEPHLYRIKKLHPKQKSKRHSIDQYCSWVRSSCGTHIKNAASKAGQGVAVEESGLHGKTLLDYTQNIRE